MPPLEQRIPTREDCLRLMRERQMMAHIVEHSLRVAEVASLLASGLTRAGELLDLPLIEAASLLHDIAKIDCLQTRADHALAGQELVVSLGFTPALGQVIRHHVHLPEDEAEEPLIRRAECEIVNYADKRCNGSLIVTLTERFDYIRGRYGRTADIVARINQLEGRTLTLERKIFARLSFGPEQLRECLEEHLGQHLVETAP